GRLPRPSTCTEPGVVREFRGQHTTIPQNQLYAARHFCWESTRESRVGAHCHALQERLDVITANARGQVLLRHHLTVQEGHGRQVRQAVICFFLRAHHGLVSLLTAADDAIGYIEDCQIHPLDLDRRNPLARAQRENRFEYALRVDL